MNEYREYCYYVAGTVGCMLTELWYEHAPSVGKPEFAKLWDKCRQFGEALQTVNILKDIAANPRFKPRELTNTRDFEIWNSWPLLMLALIFFGAEWFMRKRLGML